jgi:hypothetical protein
MADRVEKANVGKFTAKVAYVGTLVYMRNSKRVSGSNPLRGDSVQIDKASDMVEQDPFSDSSINMQIVADVSRVGSAWLEWNAEPTEGSFEDKIAETLVGTLDAHANALLRAVNRPEELPGYMKHLRRVGWVLIENAKRNSVLNDPQNRHPPLSPESLRKEVDLALVTLHHARRGTLAGDPKLSSVYATRTLQGRAPITDAAVEIAPYGEATQRRSEWCRQVIDRIETRFEARYRHWQAEALEGILRTATVSSPKGRDPVGVSNWEDVEIEFLSDERVQIWTGSKSETRNYGEMGFADKRDGKPNQSWVILRTLAQLGGTLADSAAVRKKWPAVEKHPENQESLKRPLRPWR